MSDLITAPGIYPDVPEADYTPGSDAWLRLVTASKVAAILGLSPWESPRSMWHRMRGELPDVDTAYKARGRYLEDGVTSWWLDQHSIDDWQAQQTFTLGDWALATPDGVGIDEHGNILVFDAKTAARDDDWGRPGTDQVPPYYAAQAQWQMHVSGAQVGYIAVLTSRLRFAEYVLPYEPGLAAGIERVCRAFYDSLAADVPPALDDSPATFEAIRALHPDIDRDLDVEIDRDTAARWLASRDLLDGAEAEHRRATTVLLDQMGRARRATHSGLTVARRQPNRSGVSLVRVAALADLLERTTS